VGAEDVEVAVEGTHVDMRVNRRLAAVEQHRHAPGVGEADDLGGGRDGAQHVRHMGDGDEPGTRADETGKVVDVERAVVADARPFQHRALALAQEVPRHDVGVVLHLGQHDLVARPDERREEALGDEVESLGAAMGEDDLLAAAGVHIGLRGVAGGLKGVGRRAREVVHAAMDVGVAALHEAGHRVDDSLRLLRRGGVVEIDQRAAIDLTPKDRKIGADPGDVEGRRAPEDRIHDAASSACRRARTKARMASAPGPAGKRSSASSRKASVSRARACASGMPRERR